MYGIGSGMVTGKEQTLPLTGQAPLAGSEYSSALTVVTVLSLKIVTPRLTY